MARLRRVLSTSLRSKLTGSAAPRSAPSGRVAWIALTAALVLLGVHVATLAFLCDDAFISFRYAVNLASGDGLVFNSGERVEGYSNFLWVLIVAGLRRLSVPPETGAPIVSVACAIATVGLGFGSLHGHAGARACFVLLLAASSGFAAWATGGLETALFSLLLFVSFLALVRALDGRAGEPPNADGGAALVTSAVSLLLASLTRPEGPLVATLFGAFLLARVAAGRFAWRPVLVWAASFAIPYALYLVWRHAYFGRWFPNTFAVKSAGMELLPAGLEYLSSVAVRQGLWLWALSVAALAVLRRASACGGVPLALGVVLVVPYLGYIAAVGGDFMDLGRFVVPLLPIAAWVTAHALGTVEEVVTERRGRAWGLGVVALFIGTFAAINVAATIDTLRPWHRQVDSIGLLRQYRKDWAEVARLIGEVSTPSDTIAITAAGIIPFYTGLYTIDQLGLVAADLSGYRPRTDVGLPGHKLIASGELLARLRPQFLLGHPVVVDSMTRARPSLMLERGWEARIMKEYRIVGGQVSLDPPRFFALAARKDVLERPRRGELGAAKP